MKTKEPISIGLSLQIMIDTIGQDCLLDYRAAPLSPKEYATQKKKLERLKKRDAFDPTTIKNLDDFANFVKNLAEWLINNGYTNGITMNYVDRFLIHFATAAHLQIPVGNILYIAAYSICFVIWETYKDLCGQDKNQSRLELIRKTLSIFDFFDSDSEYLKENTIFKKVFWYLDNFINDKTKLLDELSQWISDNDDPESSHELKRQIDRWIKGEQNPSWNYVKWICNEKFLPSKELFIKSDGLTPLENDPVELWKFFRQRFMLAYFINNFFNSLEHKQKLITKEQKEYLVSGIRYMFQLAFFPNNFEKSAIKADMNFVFHSLKHSFESDMPEDGLQMYLKQFIPWLIGTNRDINIGINEIFKTEAEVFRDI